jgi:hypothetical protein
LIFTHESLSISTHLLRILKQIILILNKGKLMSIFNRNDPFQSLDFERNIINPYLKEYRNNTIFDRFTGKTADSPIFVKVGGTGSGDTIVYNQRQNFAPTIKLGQEQLIMAEDSLTFGVERLIIGEFLFGIKITDKLLQELQINHKFDPELRADLLDKGETRKTQRMMQQFGLAFSDNNRGNPNQQYSYSDLIAKMLACGIDINAVGEAVSNSRLMFGKDVRAAQAIVGEVLTNANMPIETSKLTVDHISRLADLAQKGSRTAVVNKEAAIKPYMTKQNRLGYADRRYLLLTSSDAYLDLKTDPAWASQMNRGVVESEEQPSLLFGSNYKGTVDGVMVVTIPEFSNYVFENGGGKFAYSSFLGCAAIATGIGGKPELRYDDFDYLRHQGLAHIEISDSKVLKFPSKTDLTKRGTNPLRVENGMIHSFVRVS